MPVTSKVQLLWEDHENLKKISPDSFNFTISKVGDFFQALWSYLVFEQLLLHLFVLIQYLLKLCPIFVSQEFWEKPRKIKEIWSNCVLSVLFYQQYFPPYFRVIPEAHLTVPYLIKLDYPNTNCVELYPGGLDVQKKVRFTINK